MSLKRVRTAGANVEEVLRLAYEYDERGMEAFLESLALVGDQDTMPDAPDAVTMLTLHAAKGLEFGAVFHLRRG